METTGLVVSGTTYVLWAFRTGLVPLLVIFGVWRHLINHVPIQYETGLWSVVFPLGMYSVASMLFGIVAHLPFLVTAGQSSTAIAAAAWLAISVSGVRCLFGYYGTHHSQSTKGPTN